MDKTDVSEKADEDETDQELPPWIKVTKNRFNEIKDVITKANDNKLGTSIRKKKITLKNAQELLGDTISGKIDKKKAQKMYNSIDDDTNKLGKLKSTES